MAALLLSDRLGEPVEKSVDDEARPEQITDGAEGMR
jgi:hypothetical protein